MMKYLDEPVFKEYGILKIIALVLLSMGLIFCDHGLLAMIPLIIAVCMDLEYEICDDIDNPYQRDKNG